MVAGVVGRGQYEVRPRKVLVQPRMFSITRSDSGSCCRFLRQVCAFAPLGEGWRLEQERGVPVR